MENNHLYNLMRQLVQEQTSLWRITNHYFHDAHGCKTCTTFWKKIEQEKKDHVQELTKILKTHAL